MKTQIINCPYCSKETKFVKEYNDHVCKNKDCSFYLKGDVKDILVKKSLTPDDEYKINRMIDDVMDNFDFDTVHKVMKFLNWEWATGRTSTTDYEKKVPSLDEIKASAKEQMKRTATDGILNNSDYYSETGGFSVSFFKDDKDSPAEIKLDFILETWDSGCLDW